MTHAKGDWTPEEAHRLVSIAKESCARYDRFGYLAKAHLMMPQSFEVGLLFAEALAARPDSVAAEVVNFAEHVLQFAPEDAFTNPENRQPFALIAQSYSYLGHHARALMLAQASKDADLIKRVTELHRRSQRPVSLFFPDNDLEYLQEVLAEAGCSFTEAAGAHISDKMGGGPLILVVRETTDLEEIGVEKMRGLHSIKAIVCQSEALATLFKSRLPFIHPSRVNVIMERRFEERAWKPRKPVAVVRIEDEEQLDISRRQLAEAGIKVVPPNLAEEEQAAFWVYCGTRPSQAHIAECMKMQALGMMTFTSATNLLVEYVNAGRTFRLPYSREHVDACMKSVIKEASELEAFNAGRSQAIAENAKIYFDRKHMAYEWLSLLNRVSPWYPRSV